MMDLINEANDLNDWISVQADLPEEVHKELKKAEMYMRKAYIMHKWAYKHIEGELTGSEYLKEVNKALVRDYKYVQVRDNMDAYEI